VDRWIRMEELAQDFTDFISELTDVSAEDRARIASFDSVNVLDYDHDIRHWFTPDQVRRLYHNNPLWASVEERVYGDLSLID
jgi:hypothetical protein